jgi:hypothetical protein
MNIKLIFGIVLFSANVLAMCVGLLLVWHCTAHLGDPSESNASAGIEYIGQVTGAPHLVGLFLGVAIVIASLSYGYKSYKEALQYEELRDSHTILQKATNVIKHHNMV